METRILQVKNENDRYLEICGDAIRNGQIVAFPTETVYGLGANGLDVQAVKKIFKAKGRPQDNPLILHIGSMKELYPLVDHISKEAEEIMKVFWPGPLTILFKKSKLVPDIITAGLDTVAIRMPSHPIARKIIEHSERPIAAPSANTSGKPSPTIAMHVYEDMNGKIDYIVDGGQTGIGLESTVLDLSGDRPTILRPGGISYEELKPYLDNLMIDEGLMSEDVVPKSPGQKYKHYAPNGELFLYSGDDSRVNERILEDAKSYMESGKTVGIMVKEGDMDYFSGFLLKSMGSNKEEVGQNLFRLLREFDDMKVDIILCQVVDRSGIGFAIMNRMMKASGGKVIFV